ncbi:MAG: TIGR02391 family protein [Thaumarchaeota archaeon]|nr:TIGR02391 family protein [Nitrososphaerota archaeon]
MKKKTSLAPFIFKLWNKGDLNKQFTVDYIVKNGSTSGYTFTKNSVRKSLLAASFITKTKKIGKIQYYKQKFPAKSTDEHQDSQKPYIDIFKKLDLHPEIRKTCSKLFLDEHYDHAIFVAFKKINNMVKNKSGEKSKDGKNLMLTTFSVNSPILKFNKLQSVSEKDEQEGFMHIFAGSIQGIRNPRGHDDLVGGDPWQTIDYLCLASLLAKKLDHSKK